MSSACVDYVPALCTHRPSLLPIEWSGEFFGLWQRFRFAVLMPREDTQTLSFRGRRSRNKVSVGEPAEGSLSFLHPHSAYRLTFRNLLLAATLCVLPSRTLLRQTRLEVPSLLKRLCISFPPRRLYRFLYLTNTQLLSMDILA